MSETEESDAVPSESAPPSGMEFEEGASSEGELSTTPALGENEFPTSEEEGSRTEATEEGETAEEVSAPAEDVKPDAAKAESHVEEDEEDMSLMSRETEEGFSEYEQSELDEFEEAPVDAEEGIGLFPSSEVAEDAEFISKPAFSTVAASSVVPPSPQRQPSVKEKDKSEATSAESSRRKLSIDENDEEMAKIPVPIMKPNKAIPKLPEPRYPIWPVKVFETENIYKIMEKAIPRFFPRNFPYVPRDVIRRINMLAQYLQRKVFQMGHDRRKLITVVRYHQTNWNGQRSVVRWLWCMETDALIKYAHHGENYVVSAIVCGLYVD